MYHFVYLSFEDSKDGRNYIGKRSCLNPYDNYLGSFSDKSFNPTNKIILSYYKTKELKSRRIKEAMQNENVKNKLKSRKNPQKGKIWVNNGCNSLMVFPNKIPEGYKRGRSKK